MSDAPAWTVSIVSHGHGAHAWAAAAAVSRQLGTRPHRVVLTQNLPEAVPDTAALGLGSGATFVLRQNSGPQGFASNHNAALAGVHEGLLLVADPDLQLPQAIFGALEQQLAEPTAGIVAPLAQDPTGRTEDNGRPAPSPGRLLARHLLRRPAGRRPHHRGTGRQSVEWVAGLFMAMRADVFHDLGGFDAGYYMYCEDVDLCLRARARGLKVWLDTDLTIVHPARRRTFRSLRHLLWHLRSLLRLWASPAYRTRATTE